MTDRLLHPKPDRLRLQVKASKRTMSDLAMLQKDDTEKQAAGRRCQHERMSYVRHRT